MGDKLHWLVAGILGTGVAFIIIVLVFFPSPSRPTSATLGSDKLAELQPRKEITLVLPAKPSAEGDAGDDYHRAIELYKQNHDAIVEVCARLPQVVAGQDKLTEADRKLLDPIQEAIAAGAAKKGMTYSFRLTPSKIESPYHAAEAADFQNLANVPIFLSCACQAAGEQMYPKAEKCLFDLFTMGYHMMAERARMETILYGVGLQKNACDLLVRLYATKWDKPDRARQVRHYAEGLAQIELVYSGHYNRVIWRLPPALNPGDVFNLVENHADRAVRLEAVLALGVVKLTCNRRGDRMKVRRLIAKKLGSSDPIDREFAKAADALDAELLRRLAQAR
ncbi:MAG: hypothetical protein AMJ81_00550 [Phycisphaerae bacterium SM23_33]|jgi:hypothetical protein|nr:MAG: hypothetical protein AMJ81_00550 [Phycisphaerae bacterium SM23_33]